MSEEINSTDHSVVTTLTVDKGFNVPGLVNFTLVATNAGGDSNFTFWVYTDPSTIPTTPEITTEPAETTTEPSTTTDSTSTTTGAGGAATGGPPLCTATLLLMLMCARLVTG